MLWESDSEFSMVGLKDRDGSVSSGWESRATKSSNEGECDWSEVSEAGSEVSGIGELRQKSNSISKSK